jgi:hypothetical protein
MKLPGQISVKSTLHVLETSQPCEKPPEAGFWQDWSVPKESTFTRIAAKKSATKSSTFDTSRVFRSDLLTWMQVEVDMDYQPFDGL